MRSRSLTWVGEAKTGPKVPANGGQSAPILVLGGDCFSKSTVAAIRASRVNASRRIQNAERAFMVMVSPVRRQCIPSRAGQQTGRVPRGTHISLEKKQLAGRPTYTRAIAQAMAY